MSDSTGVIDRARKRLAKLTDPLGYFVSRMMHPITDSHYLDDIPYRKISNPEEYPIPFEVTKEIAKGMVSPYNKTYGYILRYKLQEHYIQRYCEKNISLEELRKELEEFTKEAKEALYLGYSACGLLPQLQVVIDAGVQTEETTRNRHGYNAIQLAASNGHLPVLKYLLETISNSSKSPLDEVKSIRRTKIALQMAIEKGHLDIVQYLIETGADVNVECSYGLTPLIFACRAGYIEIVKELISHGAVINASVDDKNGNSFTALGHTLVSVQPLFHHEQKIDKNEFFRFLNILKFLIANGANVNQPYECEYDLIHPMFHAIREVTYEDEYCDHIPCSIELVKELIQGGADVNVPDDGGSTPLFTSVTSDLILGHKITEMLIDAGADVNWKSRRNCTPMNAIFIKTLSLRSRFRLSGEHIQRNSFSENVLKQIRALVYGGAYMDKNDYSILWQQSYARDFLFQYDHKFCVDLIINRYNWDTLTTLYEIHTFVPNLPPDPSFLRIGVTGRCAESIAETVAKIMDTEGYCDPYSIVSLPLKILCAEKLRSSYRVANFKIKTYLSNTEQRPDILAFILGQLSRC